MNAARRRPPRGRSDEGHTGCPTSTRERRHGFVSYDGAAIEPHMLSRISTPAAVKPEGVWMLTVTPDRAIERTAQQLCWWVPSAPRAPAPAHCER
jgi:hypothetical protein